MSVQVSPGTCQEQTAAAKAKMPAGRLKDWQPEPDSRGEEGRRLWRGYVLRIYWKNLLGVKLFGCFGRGLQRRLQSERPAGISPKIHTVLLQINCFSLKARHMATPSFL